MTSAAAPATSGADSLVPWNTSSGWPPHSVNRVLFVLHSAQPASPGAIRSGTPPPSSMPPELNDVTLLSTQPSGAPTVPPWKPADGVADARPPPYTAACVYARSAVLAATEITSGSLDGAPTVS